MTIGASIPAPADAPDTTYARRPSLLGRIGRFGIVGVGVTAFNYWLYVTLIGIGFHYVLATSVGWALGVVISFFANKYYTFVVAGRPQWRELGGFVTGYVLQLVFGTATLVLMIDGLGIEYRIAFFVNVAMTAAFSFLFLDNLVFKSRNI